MKTKPVRISVEAEKIALQYGKSVSQGIIAMNVKCNLTVTQPVNIPVTKVTSAAERWRQKSEAGVSATGEANIGSMGRTEFWKELKKNVDGIIESAGKGY